MRHLDPLAVLAVLYPLSAGADVVRLEDLEARAVRDRPTLEASHARVRRARAAIDRAESAYYPTLSIGADASLQPGGEIVDVGGVLVQGSRALGESGALDPNPRYGVVMGLRGTLYDFGRTAAATQAARAQRGAARAEERARRVEIVRAVRSAYMAWTAAHELGGVAGQTVTDAGARRTRVEALIQEGARPEADLAPVQADEALARLEAARARGELARARLALEQAVGGPLAPGATPDASVLSRSASEEARSERPDPSLVALERQREAARATARIHDRRTRPILTAAAEGGVHGVVDDFFPAYRATLSISVPLWDGGAGAASEAAASAEAAELAARAGELREARRGEELAARADQASAEERLAIARELVDVSQTRLRQAEERYDLGSGNIESIATARSALRRARSEVVLARVARAEAALRLQSP
ncbi:MAG: TolC family protein [Deltaproteobacteria bacterium]|nr:TolC family protein [Deltaproteobacteria bacterium]